MGPGPHLTPTPRPSSGAAEVRTGPKGGSPLARLMVPGGQHLQGEELLTAARGLPRAEGSAARPRGRPRLQQPLRVQGAEAPLLRAFLGCRVWPGAWAPGAHWAAQDMASVQARPAAKERPRALGPHLGPGLGALPHTALLGEGGSSELWWWMLARGLGPYPGLGTDAPGRGWRGCHGRAQGPGDSRQPRYPSLTLGPHWPKPVTPEPHFQDNHLQTGSSPL